MIVTCLDVEPHTLRVVSSVLTALVCLLSLNSAFGATWHFSRRALGSLFEDIEKRAMLLQYVIFLPLFELFVVWGSQVDAGNIAHNCSATLLVHIIISALSLAIICSAQFMLTRFRPLLHAAQCWRIVICVAVLCDRGVRGVIGYESFFTALVLGCALFEIAHVNVIVFDEVRHVNALAAGSGEVRVDEHVETDETRAERRRFIGDVLGGSGNNLDPETPRDNINDTALREISIGGSRRERRSNRKQRRHRALANARKRLSSSFSSLPSGNKEKVKRSDNNTDEDDDVSQLIESTDTTSGFDTSTALTDGFASEVPMQAKQHFLLQKSEERIALALRTITESNFDDMNEKQLRRLLRKVQNNLQRAGVGHSTSNENSLGSATSNGSRGSFVLRRRGASGVQSSDSEMSDY